MSDRDWNKEMAKIDRQLEGVSDAALFPAAAPTAAPAEQARVATARAATSSWPVVLRLVLATALAVGVLFWPYESRCGSGLAGYLGATLAVIGAGIWSATWSWRHRTGRAHVLALLLVLWGGLLTAREVLPRVGYGRALAGQTTTWGCEVPTKQ